MTAIDWSILGKTPDLGATFQAGFDKSRRAGALSALTHNPANRDALAELYTLDPTTASHMETVGFQRQQFQQQQDALARQTQARGIVPDVLAGLGLSGSRQSKSTGTNMPSATGQDGGDVVVTAPKDHRTIADVYALDPELAGHLVTQIGSMQDQHRKQLGFEADALAAAAFAARQVPYEKRRGVIDAYRRQLGEAGFSAGEIDDYDPTDEALNAAITHSLGVKGALSNHLAEQRLAWDQEDDQIDNARDDQRVAISRRSEGRQEYYRSRADHRAQVRFGERALDRAAQAGIRTDTSDLDY